MLKKFICLMVAACALSACYEPNTNIPTPTQVCTMVTGTYPCSRGGTCTKCGQEELGCPSPLKLRQIKDYKGRPQLVCRLDSETNE